MHSEPYDALRTTAGEEKDAAIDLALEETGQMQGINVNARNDEEADDGAGGDNVYANTLLTMKEIYVLVRIEGALCHLCTLSFRADGTIMLLSCPNTLRASPIWVCSRGG